VTTPVSRPPLSTPPRHADIAIIGAGAAGIAAARRSLARGLSVAVLEARDRVGGRAVTALLGGRGIDLGAHWLHAGPINPLVALGLARGERLRRAPQNGHVVRHGRSGSRADRVAYGTAFDRADRAFSAGARREEDRAVADVLPPLGRWGRAVAATHALVSGRPLREVSLKDFPSLEYGQNYFVSGGYGAYLARLAVGLPIALGTAVRQVDLTDAGVALRTDVGSVTARAVIVTAPVPVLGAGAIRFEPGLPGEVAAAIDAFLPGVYEHVVLNWPNSPFRGPDRLAKIIGTRADYGLLTNIDGGPIHFLELDYATVRRNRAGRPGLARFARRFLMETFGARAAARLRVMHVTDWLADPWARCSWAVVAPGRFRDRATLKTPVRERIWFAGEATSHEQWGTAGGAFAEGTRAADEVADQLASSG
jgi:monoamine oxidase